MKDKGLLYRFNRMRFTLYMILFAPLFSSGQDNLIRNGDFEDYKWMPSKALVFNVDSVLYFWTSPTDGTPDYFHLKASELDSKPFNGNPINWGRYSGYSETTERVLAASGSGFIGLIFGTSNVPELESHGTEYIQSKLRESLKINHKYRLMLHYRSSVISNFTSASLNYKLSDTLISNYYKKSFNQPFYSRFYPHETGWRNISMTQLPKKWTKFQEIIKAGSESLFLTLGSFDIEFNTLDYNHHKANYVFIDDVSLIEIPCLVGPDTVCSGEKVKLTSTFSGYFEWSYKSDFSLIFSTDSNVFIIADSTKWIYLRTPFGADSLKLHVLDRPALDTLEYRMCDSDSIVISLRKDYSYLWDDGDRSDIKTIWEEGLYSLEVSNGYCKINEKIKVKKEFLRIGFSIKNVDYCSVTQAAVQARLPGEYRYVWLDNESNAIVRSFIKEGCYPFRYNTNYCSAIDSVCVIDACESVILVPTAFVPSGVNSVFRPHLKYVRTAHLVIYNRWGEKIYEELSENPSWNGYYKNYLMKQGNYLYTLRVEGLVQGDVKYLKGSFLLLN